MLNRQQTVALNLIGSRSKEDSLNFSAKQNKVSSTKEADPTDTWRAHAKGTGKPLNESGYAFTLFSRESWPKAKRSQYCIMDDKLYKCSLTEPYLASVHLIEAEAYHKMENLDMHDFVWKDIIFRHGILYETVTNNRPQFISKNL
ncbi:hypothetical protein Bca4012_089442 [Brassica carinata]